MIDKIPYINAKNIKYTNNAVCSKKLERTPIADTFSFQGTKKILDTKLTDDTRQMLDSEVFVFKIKDENCEEFKGTIREYLNNSIVRMADVKGTFPIYHCTSKENIDNILKNGLDWTKNDRMKCGPGTYFSGSLGAGEFYGCGYEGIKAKYTGKKKQYPVFKPCFYEPIAENKNIVRKIKALNKNADSRKILNKYCHDILCDEMKFDFLYASTGRSGGCYVVLNDNCTKLSKA